MVNTSASALNKRCHLTNFICQRLGIKSTSDQYLANYMKSNLEVPPISFECVMKVSGLIEQMGKQQLKQRKEKE
jgi:hypothetical protein